MRIAIIYNPTAGRTSQKKRLRRLQSCLQNYGHTLQLLATAQAWDASRFACDAVADGVDLVLAVGGDGTVNEVIQGLVGSNIPLAVYPMGTTNVWCHQIGMPANPVKAAAIINSGIGRSVDLGLAGNRYFLLMAGIGIDAEVTRTINLNLKRRWGQLIYAVEALRLCFTYPSASARVVLEPGSPNEQIIEGRLSLIIVTNTERYATVKLAPFAQLDDGQLDLLLFQTTNPWVRLAIVAGIMLNLGRHRLPIKSYRVSRASLETTPSVAVQLDGEATGLSDKPPLEISCLPAALKVIVPATAPAYLFSH